MEANILKSINHLSHNRIYSFEEALELVSLLNTISAKSKRELNQLNSQMSFLKKDTEKHNLVQQKINSELQKWSEKIRRLGLTPVSFCKVRISGENDQYLWEYPENRLFMA